MSRKKASDKKIHSSKWFARKYYRYKRDYFKRVAAMENKGLTPVDRDPEKFRNWKAAYIAEYNDRRADLEKGERKSIGDINKKLISDGVYELSERQAYAIFDYMKNLSEEERTALNFSYKNINTAIAKIRQGEFVREELGLWDLIRARRAELFSEGKSKADVAAQISQDFFYPKEGK